jgi:hypothetical protein
MAEWSNAAVLKTVDRLRGPGVRIPLSPPEQNKSHSRKRMVFYFQALRAELARASMCLKIKTIASLLTFILL